MKTYICKECGNKIKEVELDHGYTQRFDECGCDGHRITIPLDHYESYMDMKCPYCKKYPFKKAPISEIKRAIITIDVNEEIDSVL